MAKKSFAHQEYIMNNEHVHYDYEDTFDHILDPDLRLKTPIKCLHYQINLLNKNLQTYELKTQLLDKQNQQLTRKFYILNNKSYIISSFLDIIDKNNTIKNELKSSFYPYIDDYNIINKTIRNIISEMIDEIKLEIKIKLQQNIENKKEFDNKKFDIENEKKDLISRYKIF
jgi:hypothetical protein